MNVPPGVQEFPVEKRFAVGAFPKAAPSTSNIIIRPRSRDGQLPRLIQNMKGG